MQFLNDSLFVENNDYLTKIVNVCIVCDLDSWWRNPLNTFMEKNCLLRATNIVKKIVIMIKVSICMVPME